MLLIFLLVVFSCVNDDDFFLDKDADKEITSTASMITVFNSLKNKDLELNESNVCFSFKYPLVLRYNNDSTIYVNDFEGLLRAIYSQDINFNLVGLRLPVEVFFQKTETSFILESEEDFVVLLKECEIQTFRDEINTLLNRCFKFDYPFLLRDKEKKETVIDDENGFKRFLENNGVEYQPDFKFPIKILVSPEFKAIKVLSYYEFYKVINNCVECPDISFQIESLSDNKYRFVPDFEIEEEDQLFLEINGEIDTQVMDDNSFEKSFSPGVYEICMKTRMPDCLGGKEFCKELIVEPICPEITFDYEEISSPYTYRFVPRVEVADKDITVSWYVNNVFVSDELLSFGYVDINLDQGSNTVCAEVKTINCPDGERSCIEVRL
ncbi:hypothetical protein [Aquimarina muelleri]|uniref:hypothetical protein n=1 Tax=Aquimarina muelleri TaxID=279356 RepID=UPI0003F648C8|nr:hypothetical protein [Aquimarina muelleri]MCX2761797.1 hypothetical protein [Aquimarina muelleri]